MDNGGGQSVSFPDTWSYAEKYPESRPDQLYPLGYKAYPDILTIVSQLIVTSFISIIIDHLPVLMQAEFDIADQ